MQLNLGVKVNVVVIAVLGTLLVTILVLLDNGVANLTTAIVRERVAQEMTILQREFDQAQQTMFVSANLLATDPTIQQALTGATASDAGTDILVSAVEQGFDGISLFRADGTRVMSTHAPTALEQEQEEQLLPLALLNIQTIGIISSTEPAKLVLTAAVPVRDGADNQLGILLAHHEIDDAFLKDVYFAGADTYLALMYNGQTLAHTRSAQDNPGTAQEPFNIPLIDPGSLSQVMRGQTIIRDEPVTLERKPYALSYAPLIVESQPVAVIAVLTDVSELAAFDQSLTHNLALLCILLSLIAMGAVMLFIWQNVSRPLRQLQGVAEEMASGNYSQRANVRRWDEIGRLARAFNRTAGAVEEREIALQQLAASLEQQVADRTAELQQQAEERTRLQEEIIQIQAATLAELSTPLIPITDHVIALPLIGSVDSQRAQQVLDTLLHGVAEHRAHVVILDVTGVRTVDTQVASALLQSAQACRLLGAEVILTGIRPEVAQTLVGLGVDMSGLVTQSTLQAGIQYTLRQAQARRSALEKNGKNEVAGAHTAPNGKSKISHQESPGQSENRSVLNGNHKTSQEELQMQHETN